MKDINKHLITDFKRERFYYTWRDILMVVFFLYLVLEGVIVRGDHFASVYNIATSVMGLLGVFSVVFKWKRAEAVVIITIGLLIASRALLLTPPVTDIKDIVMSRPLLDGIGSIFPLIVLAEYRKRRGRITR